MLGITSVPMQALEHKIPPPVVGAVVAAAMWGLASFQPFLHIPPFVRHAAVAAFVAGGVAFDVLGLVAFRRARTTVNPLTPSKASALVTHGIYRFTRNPMYIGIALLLTAWACHLSALWPFLGPVLFVLYINRFQIEPEERVLKALFGEEYAAYAASVRRWL